MGRNGTGIWHMDKVRRAPRVDVLRSLTHPDFALYRCGRFDWERYGNVLSRRGTSGRGWLPMDRGGFDVAAPTKPVFMFGKGHSC